LIHSWVLVRLLSKTNNLFVMNAKNNGRKPCQNGT
jgi:hypothetical protein